MHIHSNCWNVYVCYALGRIRARTWVIELSCHWTFGTDLYGNVENFINLFLRLKLLVDYHNNYTNLVNFDPLKVWIHFRVLFCFSYKSLGLFIAIIICFFLFFVLFCFVLLSFLFFVFVCFWFFFLFCLCLFFLLLSLIVANIALLIMVNMTIIFP